MRNLYRLKKLTQYIFLINSFYPYLEYALKDYGEAQGKIYQHLLRTNLVHVFYLRKHPLILIIEPIQDILLRMLKPMNFPMNLQTETIFIYLNISELFQYHQSSHLLCCL